MPLAYSPFKTGTLSLLGFFQTKSAKGEFPMLISVRQFLFNKAGQAAKCFKGFGADFIVIY